MKLTIYYTSNNAKVKNFKYLYFIVFADRHRPDSVFLAEIFRQWSAHESSSDMGRGIEVCLPVLSPGRSLVLVKFHFSVRYLHILKHNNISTIFDNNTLPYLMNPFLKSKHINTLLYLPIFKIYYYIESPLKLKLGTEKFCLD